MYLTQKNQIKGLSRREEKALRALCLLSKNIYSVGSYEVRHIFFKTPPLLTYNSNVQSGKHRDNCKLLHSGTSQQTVKVAERQFKLF
jgi:hypothetical protein